MSPMFEPTLPLGSPELASPSAFRRYLDDLVRDGDSGSTRLSSLSPSLMQDLLRFEQHGRQTELLEVLAASIRHGRPLATHLRCLKHVLTLTCHPVRRMLHCRLPLAQLLELPLSEIEVLHVEPALRELPPDDLTQMAAAEQARYHPLGAFSWELALRGARGELLPEISSAAAYRIPPGADLSGLYTAGSIADAVARLRRGATNLREMSDWPGFDRDRAMRLLNALYLQAALMVTRAHPAATNDGWRPEDSTSRR